MLLQGLPARLLLIVLLQGFRRYEKILETLLHELVHIVWGDHDDNFKQLNSQLLREAKQLDWTSQPGVAACMCADGTHTACKETLMSSQAPVTSPYSADQPFSSWLKVPRRR